MVPVTALAHQLVQHCLNEGDIAVDATMGNGHDTLFLAKLVGATGRVFAIDLQQSACDATLKRLSDDDVKNVTLFCGDHARMESLIPQNLHGHVCVVMFNLGYLPGGDKQVITKVDGTLAALDGSLALLKSGGVICVAAYRGHPGGAEEAIAVENWMNNQFQNGHLKIEFNRPTNETAPLLLALRKA
ncbi:class I SAM-dependent methyltransferase [Planctomicrobium sp. SH527]|uniref:tRNA (mnm(5)s(2)U34)-methyltransferase n=1 Tax=Planctomicrobium sp. SH527 TaxID=3448123 RepID=UPI003F5C22A9